jgi:hypothetical protein
MELNNMNIQIKTSIIIFSVYKQTNLDILNHDATRVALKNSGIQFKEVEACYKGQKEKSFVIENTLANFNAARNIALEFGQERILIRDSESKATLYFLDFKAKQPIELGSLNCVTKEYALAQDAWTYDKEHDQYYCIIK